MSVNLILGILACAVGVATLYTRFFLPDPPKSVANPYAHRARSGWFAPIVLGIVPLVAGLTFLGAWWQGGGDPPAELAVYQRGL